MSFSEDLDTILVIAMAACAYIAYFRTGSLIDEIVDLNDRLDSIESKDQEKNQKKPKND